MRALRFEAYGGPEVLHLVELPAPAPAAGELLVRVRAASLNPLDWKLRAGHLRFVPGFPWPPRGTLCDFAGEVAATGGGNVAGFYPGARVFGALSPRSRQGSAADFVTVPARDVAVLPLAIDFDVAAALPIAAGSAVQALADHARVARGQRVLVSGAAGGVGHFAVQYARHLGADVTGVCGPDNVAFVHSLGCSEVIDYTSADALADGKAYDVVFDAAGVWSWHGCRKVLAPEGVFINTNPDARSILGNVAGGVAARLGSRQQVIGFVLKSSAAAWRRLAALAASGVLVPHLAARLTLDDVAAAQRAMEGGHGCGKQVVVL
jgi:NADPH:quinone reductase-like Zn-dependent oxidoreductase